MNAPQYDAPLSRPRSSAPAKNRRGLEAVASCDRRKSSWTAVYVEFTAPAEADRRGCGLKPTEALWASRMIEVLGDPMDGRRGSVDYVPPLKVNGAYLLNRYCGMVRSGEEAGQGDESEVAVSARSRSTLYGQLRTAVARLARPVPCSQCGRGHAFIRLTPGKRGGSNSYALVRCADLREQECVSFEAAIPVKRVRTGAPAGASSRGEVSGFSDTFFTAAPLAEDDARARLVAAMASVFGGCDLPGSVAAAIASYLVAMDADSAMYEQAFTAVIARASLSRRDLATLAFEEIGQWLGEALSGKVSSFSDSGAATSARKVSEVSETSAGGGTQKVSDFSHASALDDGALRLVIEHARRAEPKTPRAVAVGYRDEFLRLIAARGFVGRKAEDELVRILTDPRVTAPGVRKPIAVIRKGLRPGGCLWEACDDLDESVAARGLANLYPGVRAEAEAIMRRAVADGRPPDFAALKRLGIEKPEMIAALRARCSGR